MSDLIGGIQYVTLSDDEAKRRGTQKSILERKAYPAFQIVIEINDSNSWTIHENVKDSIDSLLKGNFTITQIRHLSSNSRTNIKYKNCQTNSLSLIKQLGTIKNPIFCKNDNWISLNKSRSIQSKNLKSKRLVVYLYSLSNNLVREVINKMPLEFIITKELQHASIILGSRVHLSRNNKLRMLAKKNNILIYSIEPNNLLSILKLLV